MRPAWLGVVLSLALGCGRGRDREPASGAVAHDGGAERLDDRKRRAWRSNAVEPAAGATTCAKFAGQALAATWDDCTDHVRRELACSKDARDEIECLCVEDGVEKWRFTARDPHLDDQAEATRVARSNCHMSFQGF